MAASLNRVTLIGNVGKDPDVRYTQKGEAIVSFSLATTEKWDGGEKTEWHRVDVFGKLASALKDYITKGKRLFVEGKLAYEEWEDKSGNKRITAKVKVTGFNSNIILLSGPNGSAAARSEDEEEPRPKKTVASDDDVPF